MAAKNEQKVAILAGSEKGTSSWGKAFDVE